ncbi:MULTISPECIES: exo 1,3/1,4-beta-D-glucan glucohydrolase [unclassified Caulobacter]|uniref:glycoside hydrolase family 3 protein n=1 Tax=unclassified Caulobacter TaxID=2648921 RepID=UPI0007010EF6|nr:MULTISPECIES: exo 1,3/1,4-beta-D-glucan glucohydrolase [unclassified Caulobacter]KQV55842.1 1,4-beta-D-glucan glucohydrolase [Caulobacter sp. Root342]KQV70983.1 1,4-beta-D-glucan glucohydrolase [Caulobacter sp. Root343]
MNTKTLCVALLASTFLTGATAVAESPQATAHPAQWPAAKSQGLVDPATEAFVDGLLAKLTLEEKVGQVIQADISQIKPEDLKTYPLGSILGGGSSPPIGAPDRSPQKPWVDTARAFREGAAQRQGGTPIPLMFGMDAVHGNNNVVGATLFPHNIALGAAHDPELIRRIGKATALETSAAGFDWAFGPTLAVPRDDRWGRTYEGYSEDPAIVRDYAGQMILGLQGAVSQGGVIQQGHVAASAKHFLGDGGTENGHDQGDTKVPESELIRLHAQGYVPAINAGTLTIMASFNSWNGTKMHGNKSLLTDVLKGRMGFDGFVVGDWNGHGQVPGCKPTDCPQSINAGLDMFMAPDSWKALYANTLAEVKSGVIPMARLDDAVRRILRVKAKMGLFQAARPNEGREGVIGAPEHRAIAREAVRKSLVLLKNNGVLPVKASATVLVAGSGADDIGKQSGGWTLSWQGTGNANADFPNAESIWSGVKTAVEAGGGKAALAVDGAFDTKPDVAIVVFGENPYAEGVGDLKTTLEYQPGAKTDLALLKSLKAKGVPVVAVFLSGRPLWVNPEINASDAFVAAWLPGSEGGGIADVLIGDKAGKPRNDFHGKLSFSWPKTAAQFTLNKGDKGYDPLFAYGYGLSYARPGKLGKLSEVSGVKPVADNAVNYFVGGKTPPPFEFRASPSTAVQLAPVDAGGVQEAGRQVTFSGDKPGKLSIVGDRPLDLSFQTNADMALSFDYRLDAAASKPVILAIGAGRLDVTPPPGTPTGQWASVKIPLKCFQAAGTDVTKVVAPFELATAGTFQVSIANVKLTADPAGAVCPAKAAQ